jgi:hypothetical protein
MAAQGMVTAVADMATALVPDMVAQGPAMAEHDLATRAAVALADTPVVAHTMAVVVDSTAVAEAATVVVAVTGNR